MKIAVTAASGQVGAAIVKAATQLIGSDGVIAVFRTPEKAKGLGVEAREGSSDDPAALVRAFAGVDTVLLVSGMDAPDKRICSFSRRYSLQGQGERREDGVQLPSVGA